MCDGGELQNRVEWDDRATRGERMRTGALRGTRWGIRKRET